MKILNESTDIHLTISVTHFHIKAKQSILHIFKAEFKQHVPFAGHPTIKEIFIN